MTDLLQAITDIIHPDIRDISSPLRLVEYSSGSTCAPISLNRQGRAVMLRSDDSQGVSRWLSSLFHASEPGITRICDFIIFYHRAKNRVPSESARLFVVLCELKSSNTKGAVKQLRNGKILSDYIIDMARHHKDVHRATDIVYRGLVFSNDMRSTPKMREGKPLPYRKDDRFPELCVCYLRCGMILSLEAVCRD